MDDWISTGISTGPSRFAKPVTCWIFSALVVLGSPMAVGAQSPNAAPGQHEHGQAEPIEVVVRSGPHRFASRGRGLITTADIDNYLAGRMPQEHRSGFLIDPKRVSTMLQNLVMPRQLARLALDEKLEQEAEVQARMLQGIVSVLADAYLDRYTKLHALDDYEVVARENFLRSNQTKPARLSFTQLMVQFNQDELLPAMQKTIELADQISGNPEMFDELVGLHSEDPAVSENKGRYQDIEPNALVEPIREALFSMQIGEISGVIQSPYGWHILRLDELKESQPVAFEQVRAEFIEQAREQHFELIKGRLLSELAAEPMLIEDGAVAEMLERYEASFGVFSDAVD